MAIIGCGLAVLKRLEDMEHMVQKDKKTQTIGQVQEMAEHMDTIQ
jgi:hypothetical protein